MIKHDVVLQEFEIWLNALGQFVRSSCSKALLFFELARFWNHGIPAGTGVRRDAEVGVSSSSFKWKQGGTLS